MKQEILNLLQEILPHIDFTSSDALVDGGILDSVTVVTVISELSVEYDITIPYEEVIPENFNSLDAIVKLVERLKK